MERYSLIEDIDVVWQETGDKKEIIANKYLMINQ
jgi:hypothetical protein